jgi:hypothetical protein
MFCDGLSLNIKIWSHLMNLPITLLTLILAFAGSALTARLVRPISSEDAVRGTIGAFVIAVGVFLYFGFGHFDDAPEATIYGFAAAFFAAPFVCAGAFGVRRIATRIRIQRNRVRLSRRAF